MEERPSASSIEKIQRCCHGRQTLESVEHDAKDETVANGFVQQNDFLRVQVRNRQTTAQPMTLLDDLVCNVMTYSCLIIYSGLYLPFRLS